jgi:acyl-CoA synthetase (NDP forming)
MTETADGAPPQQNDHRRMFPSSLLPVLAPRAVAVVGAGLRHGGAGHEALRALRDYGFRGRLFAVNESGRPVCGIPARRSVAALPAPVDLLVLAVPQTQIAGVLADAGPLGARGAVLLDAGASNGEPATGRCRPEILQIARRQRIRLLGPASLGVLNTDPAVRLNGSLAPVRPPAGGLAVAVRSAAVGVALLADAVREHCGVSTLVSLGDEIDVAGADLLAHWLDDPGTRAVALSPEPFGDPARLAGIIGELSRRKPVLAVGGDDLLAAAGAVRTASVGETLDAARMLIDQPLPGGNRTAVVGNAGGLTALAAATARAHGFDVVPPSTLIDLGADAHPAVVADVAETAAARGDVDILLLVLVSTRADTLAATVSALNAVVDNHPALTVAAVVADGMGELVGLGRRGAPVFREPEQAVRALAHARDYAWRWETLNGMHRLAHRITEPQPVRPGAFEAGDLRRRLPGSGRLVASGAQPSRSN